MCEYVFELFLSHLFVYSYSNTTLFKTTFAHRKKMYSAIIIYIILCIIFKTVYEYSSNKSSRLFVFLSLLHPYWFCNCCNNPWKRYLKPLTMIMFVHFSSFITFSLHVFKLCHLVCKNLGLLYLPVELLFLSLRSTYPYS